MSIKSPNSETVLVLRTCDNRAMEILANTDPMRASELGWKLWGENETGGGEGSHRNNKFCRPAGAVLHRLRRLGLVASDFNRERKGNYWRVLSVPSNKESNA